MPGLHEASTGQRVIFLPEEAIQTGDAKSTKNDEDTKSSVRIVKLPKNGSPALFLINCETRQLYELMSFAESNRSWFIGDAVIEDGSLILSTPVNPIFIILPFLIKADKNVPLEDLLDDPEYPNLHEIACLSSGLLNVGCQLGDPDLNVWKYDQQKCMKWLEERVKKVKDVVEDQKIDLSGGATSLIYQANNQASSGMVNTVYANTTMSITLKCQDQYKIEFGWMLRKSPCWEEYNIYSRPYQDYFQNPDQS